VEVPLARFLALAAAALVLPLSAVPAAAQLLGLEQYFAPPKVEYSADVFMTGDGEPITGRVMRTPDKERRELTVEGDVEIIIVRVDRKLVWSLAPDENLYTESSLDEALGRNPDPSGQRREPHVTIVPQGSESVAGIPATKQRVTGNDVDGAQIDGTVWLSGDGIVLRSESDIVDEDGNHHILRTELKNLRVEPQGPGLFDIPAGYKKVIPSKVGSLGEPRSATAFASAA
jgi:hypothetical protein